MFRLPAAAALRQGRRALVNPQKRWYPANMRTKKNPVIEEWNGKREITERSFEFDFGSVPTFVLLVIIFPGSMYFASRWELNKRDPRYFKELL